MTLIDDEQNRNPEFKWLHLSDLHVGMTDQDWLWPTLKHLLYEDMRLLFSQVGAWDLVIFSGDLTQKGSPEEFERLSVILDEIWKVFKSWGFSPKLIVLPGNHDIARASSLSPELRLLRRWWDETDIHREFFLEGNSYLAAVNQILAPYREWTSSGLPNIELLEGNPGLLPGDRSYEITIGNFTIGIVGLNSTWLQIDGSDYDGKLNIDVRQLLAVTADDPHAWCTKHVFNLIVTHHPIQWLHPNSQATWASEINPSGRFDVHLFGHLHEASSNSISTGGSLLKNSLQATSLFGLAYTKDSVERRHGYSAARLTIGSHTRDLRLYPRVLRLVQGGDRKLGPDLSFNLEQDNSLRILLNERNDAYVPLGQQLALRLIANDGLKKIRYHLPPSGAHTNVRKIEQRRLLEMLAEDRAAWLVADWGMDSDGFISSVRNGKSESDCPVYRIDFTEYKNRDQFLDTIRDALDCSFQQLCELISQAGNSILILDNFPVGGVDSSPQPNKEIEDLVQVILEYCPNLSVLIRCSREPMKRRLQMVHLTALDEADLRTYILEHERGGAEWASLNSVGLLLRLTDGIPSRIDRTLKELQVVPVSELINTDLAIGVAGSQADSPSLAKTINELADSDEATHQRTFGLLKVLSLFPKGEQLIRVKRFFLNAPFYPANATELLDRALIEVTSVQGLDAGGDASLAKTLVVPRSVRERIRNRMDGNEMTRMNHRAAEVYFGSQWLTGTFRFPPAYKFDEPHCGDADITNASTIIIRLFREAISADDMQNVARVLGLAEFYLKALIRGNHYNSAMIFCDEMVPLIPGAGFEAKVASLQSLHARSLRMLGEHERAKSILLKIAQFPFPKETRQTVLIDLAFCYESLKVPDQAIRVAREIVEIDRHSNSGLQARALLIELDEGDSRRTERLIRMESLCRKRGANIAANNIALVRARENEDRPDEVRRILAPVVKSARDNTDYYNRTRATLRLSELSLNAGEKLSEDDLLYLINAYHFLFNERLPALFDRCHDSLWRTFEKATDIRNLLTLFRHSSLYWRLRGRDVKEVGYLKNLSKLVENSIGDKRLSSLSREAACYRIRAAGEALPSSTPKTIAP